MVTRVGSQPRLLPLLKQQDATDSNGTDKTNEDIKKILKNGRFWDLLKGLYNSRVLRCLFSAVAIGVVIGLTLPVSTPALVAYIACSIIFTIGLNMVLFKGRAKMKGELSSALRLTKNYSCNKIEVASKKGNVDLGKMHIGALPNRLSDSFFDYLIDNNIKVIVSINESWEKENRFLNVPLNKDLLAKAGIEYIELGADDHTSPSNQQLDTGAISIYDELKKNKNVLIHCLAGKGRSAHFPAAVMIKHMGFDATEAAQTVVNSRKVSTLFKYKKGKQTKIEALKAFANSLTVDS